MLKASSTQQTSSQSPDAAPCSDEQEEELRVALQLPLLSEEEYNRMQMDKLGDDMSLTEYAQVTVHTSISCCIFNYGLMNALGRVRCMARINFGVIPHWLVQA